MSHSERTARERLTDALTRWMGLDPDSMGTSAIERACRIFRERLGVGDDDDALLARIESDPEERDRLVEELVVPESWFFRDRASLEFVAEWILARANGPFGGRRPVRILCVPAAAGEEPRSLAMLLLEAGAREDAFRIDAFDLSRAAVRRAAEGRYTVNAFRDAGGPTDDRLNQWFRIEGQDYHIDDRIARLATVGWGNVVDEAFAPPSPVYDVICCRNLLIYLSASARRAVVGRLDDWLVADGLLLVGSAEPAMLLDRFSPASDPTRFVLRKAAAKAGSPATHGRKPPAAPARPARYSTVSDDSSRSKGSPSGLVRAASTRRSATPDEPGVHVLPAGGESESPLLLVESLANERRYEEAIRICRDLLDREGPSAEGFFLLGTIQRTLGRETEALDSFRKAVYLDPAHVDAALALALVRRASP